MLVESKWGMEMVMGYGQADLVNFENPLVWITVKHIGMLDFIFLFWKAMLYLSFLFQELYLQYTCLIASLQMDFKLVYK